MNQSKNILTQIKVTNNRIQKSINTIIKKIEELPDEIKQSAILIDMLKEHLKSHTYKELSQSLNMTACEAKELHKLYNTLTKRNTVDKFFVESLGIIPKPTKKIHKKLPKRSNNSIVELASISGKIRSLNNTKNMSDDEREIIKQMVNQLNEELKG
jgi:hypothetical protein